MDFKYRTDQDGIYFLFRDRFYPTVPILGGSLPILLVNICAGTQPIATRLHWGLKFLQEFPERLLELFRCSGMWVLHARCCRCVSLTTCIQNRAMHTGWPGPFSKKTNERAVCNCEPHSWMHVKRRRGDGLLFTSVYKKSTNPRNHHRCLPLAAKTA